MRVSDVMSARPIVVGPDSRREAVRRLMERAEVHHVPVIDGGRVAGVWLATREGPLVLLGPEHVDQTFPEADAEEAMTALIEDSEAVLVWDAGVPAGIVTPTDLRRVVRQALTDGAGRRAPRPVVVVLSGEEGAGKTTLLMRTLGLLDTSGVAVVQANAPRDGLPHEIAGVPAIDAPQAHWRSGLGRAIARLGGARLVLVEDLDGPCDPEVDAGEDLRIVVVDARDAHGVPQWTLRRASAVVIARADDADPATVAAAAETLARPDRPVFVTAAGHDDRGLADWAAWLRRRAGGVPGRAPLDHTGAFAREGDTCRPAHRGGVAGDQ